MVDTAPGSIQGLHLVVDDIHAACKELIERGVDVMSVKESTRVANAGAKTSRQKAGQRGGAATSYANWKVPELRRRAKKAGIKGRSTMNKKQLIKALRTS